MKKEDLQVLFDTHPNTDEFYITTDDQAFFAENMADAHAQKLRGERIVKCVKRSDLATIKDNAEEPTTQETAEGVSASDEVTASGTAEAPKTPLQIAQETPEAERTSYQKGLITKALNAAAEGGAE